MNVYVAYSVNITNCRLNGLKFKLNNFLNFFFYHIVNNYLLSD